MRLKAVVHNVNVRGCEARENKSGEPYLLVRFEDETGTAHELVDKDMDRQAGYKRDTDMNLTIDIDQGRKFTTIRIIDAKVIE